jgi:hypothetical protein
MSIQVKKITYTPADIFAMFVTPQLVLPAPPAGKVNNILAVSHDLVFNTLAYTVATEIWYGLQPSAGVTVFTAPTILDRIANTNIPSKDGQSLQSRFSTTKDFFVTTDSQAVTGDSNIIAYIVYEQKTLD